MNQQATSALQGVRKFSGDEDNKTNLTPFSDFHREIETIFKAYIHRGTGMSDVQHDALRVRSLNLRLKGSALVFLEGWLSTHKNSTYDETVAALVDRYDTPTNSALIQQELDSLSQKEIGSIAALQDKIGYLTQKYIDTDPQLAGASQAEKDMAFKLITKKALHKSISKEIFETLHLKGKTGDFVTMVEAAKELETKYKYIRAREENSRVTKTHRIMMNEERPEIAEDKPVRSQDARNFSNQFSSNNNYRGNYRGQHFQRGYYRPANNWQRQERPPQLMQANRGHPSRGSYGTST